MAKVVKNSETKSRGGSKKGERRGGRQKGTPNKKTLEFVEALGDFNPVSEMIKLFHFSEKEDIKVIILKEMLKYIYPQRKAVDIGVEKQTGINIIVADEKHKQMLGDL